jgi:hypothetical protein
VGRGRKSEDGDGARHQRRDRAAGDRRLSWSLPPEPLFIPRVHKVRRPLNADCTDCGRSLPSSRGPGGFLFFKRLERRTAPSVIQVCGLRVPHPPIGFGFFCALVNAHLLVAVAGTGEGDDLPEHSSDVDRSVTGRELKAQGMRPSDIAKTLQRVLGQRVDH